MEETEIERLTIKDIKDIHEAMRNDPELARFSAARSGGGCSCSSSSQELQ